MPTCRAAAGEDAGRREWPGAGSNRRPSDSQPFPGGSCSYRQGREQRGEP